MDFRRFRHAGTGNGGGEGLSGGAGGRWRVGRMSRMGVRRQRARSAICSPSYYATPETWEVAHALDTVIQKPEPLAVRPVASRREGGDCGGRRLRAVAALVLRGNRWMLAHVGDTRIYRLRGEPLQRLAQDRTWEQPGVEHVLKRAVGLDTRSLRVDFAEGECGSRCVSDRLRWRLATAGAGRTASLLQLRRAADLRPQSGRRGAASGSRRQFRRAGGEGGRAG